MPPQHTMPPNLPPKIIENAENFIFFTVFGFIHVFKGVFLIGNSNITSEAPPPLIPVFNSAIWSCWGLTRVLNRPKNRQFPKNGRNWAKSALGESTLLIPSTFLEYRRTSSRCSDTYTTSLTWWKSRVNNIRPRAWRRRRDIQIRRPFYENKWSQHMAIL